MSTREIVLPAPKHSHFIMLPFIADDELDPYETKLFLRYLRLSWGTGKPVSLSGPKGRKACRMGERKFYKTRQSLHDKGYIILTESPEHEQPDIVEVCVDKIWTRNAEKYQSAEEIGRDFTAHIISGRLDKEQLWEIKELIDQMLEAPPISGTPSADSMNPSADRRSTLLESEEHLVDIKIIKKDSNPDGSAEPPAGPTGGTPAAGFSKEGRAHAVTVTPTTQPSPADRPIAQNIEDHPLVLAIVEVTGGKRLSRNQLEQLQATIIRKSTDGGKHKYPSLIHCYDTYTGFDKFVEARLEQFEKSGMDMPIDWLISNLRNFHKENGRWIGWLKWKREHPEYTTERAAQPDPNAPVPVVYVDVSPEAAARWLHNDDEDVIEEIA